MLNKLSTKLRELAKDLPDFANVDVVLELEQESPKSSESRTEGIEMAQQSYRKLSLPVKDAVARLGGKVIGGAWVDSTVRATIPKEALDELSQEQNIRQIDDGVARPISRE